MTSPPSCQMRAERDDASRIVTKAKTALAIGASRTRALEAREKLEHTAGEPGAGIAGSPSRVGSDKRNPCDIALGRLSSFRSNVPAVGSVTPEGKEESHRALCRPPARRHTGSEGGRPTA